jgi:Na+/glutamate symporter
MAWTLALLAVGIAFGGIIGFFIAAALLMRKGTPADQARDDNEQMKFVEGLDKWKPVFNGDKHGKAE